MNKSIDTKRDDKANGELQEGSQEVDFGAYLELSEDLALAEQLLEDYLAHGIERTTLYGPVSGQASSVEDLNESLGERSNQTMDQHEKYLYDLQGYITVPDALDADQLRRLNEEVDRHIEAECPSDMLTHRFFDTIDWGGPLLDLIDNPRVRPYLDATIGEDAYRLDHVYLDVIRSGKGPIGTKLHGGGVPTRSLQYYRFEEGRMWNGLSVVAYNLHDVGPMDGGFGAVPGSHKSNYPFPDEWKEMDELQPIVRRVTGPAGTAIVFTEALAHGTLPWTGDHERRTLFFKYSPHASSWYARYYNADDYPGLNDRQRAILEAPNNRYSYRHERTPGSRPQDQYTKEQR